MCGLFGVIGTGENPSLDNEFRKGLCAIAHRGPDKQDWVKLQSCAREIYLGHSRLSIVDHSGGGQPTSLDRYCMVFNGEIYNFIEVRNELLKKGC